MSRVVASISAFQSSPSVLALLDRIDTQAWPVERVRVVDSLGDGSIPAAIDAGRWGMPVEYESHAENLGSAGNLRRRIEWAAEAGGDWVLALNHDADLDRVAVDALVAATGRPGVGALYPLKYMTGRGDYSLTGTRPFPFRYHGVAVPPAGDVVPVTWGSSNGALYATAPLRDRGVAVLADLWMGWEDYLYGLDLAAAGYRQYVVTAARTDESYEFKTEHVAGREVTVSDKPAWYLYYGVRNMLITNLHAAPSASRAAKTLAWTGMMASHVWIKRDARHPLRALRAYAAGVRDGLLDRRGKWTLP